jgi:hypothetical protein
MIRTAENIRAPRRLSKLIGALIGAVALLGLAGPASALADPVLSVTSTHVLSSVPAGTYAKYTLSVSNTGADPTSGDVTVDFSVPADLKVVATDDELNQAFGAPAWACAIAGDSQSVSCAGTESTAGIPIEPGQEACSDDGVTCRLIVLVKADPDASPGPASPTIQASGGSATTPATTTDPIQVDPPPAFSVKSFDGEALKANGDPETRAGSHPDSASTAFTLGTLLTPYGLSSDGQLNLNGQELAGDDLKNAVVKLPPGVLANPQAYPTCQESQIQYDQCPPESQVGLASFNFVGLYGTPGETNYSEWTTSVFNMQAGPGTPALLALDIAGVVVQIVADVRTGDDYGATVTVKNTPQTLPVAGTKIVVWGVPADPSHDSQRLSQSGGCPSGCSSSAPLKPFFTLPTSCTGAPLETFLDVTGWQGGEAGDSFLSHDNGGVPDSGITDCAALGAGFLPTLQARPTTNVADAPSGLDVDLHIPQNEDPNGTATAHLKDTNVTLPEGLTVNPSGANGLGTCSEAQFGYTTTDPDGTIHTTPDAASCPDAAKLGTVEVQSPLLDHSLEGAVYIAKPFDNPFDSLLALYITVDDPQTGVVVKLAGKVTPDPQTGQLTATFENNPQLPFEHFLLHFFGGAGGSLRTPAVCGAYETTSSLTPWSAPDSGPPATPSDPWSITQGPNGAACATSASEQPNSPSLDAGTISPVAASYTPGVVTLRREDGSQQFKSVTLSPPPGMLGKLAGIPACTDAQITQAKARNNPGDGATEQVDPSCPAASQVGTVDVAAGAGPSPYNASGKVYMAGPYQGAPLSFVIVTPAVAGPFDLGVVVVQTALHIDPATAQITAVTDNIPSILDGIPLDVRTAAIKLDRDQFIRTGTSCDEQKFAGSLLSTLDQSAPLSQRFQLAECSGLGFKPSLKLSLKGGTKRNGHPAFTSVLSATDGQANLGKVQVTLPPTMQLDQSHIQAPCTRPQFAANQCPEASIIGSATATSPLVDYQLSGPVYLRTGNNPLPDIVLALKGPASQPIEIDTVGKVDTVNARLRTTIDTIPDAPVTKAVISLDGGGKGLLVNNTNLCTHRNNATVLLDGQNNKTADSNPKVAVAGCKKPRKGHKHHKHHKRHHRRHHRVAR